MSWEQKCLFEMSCNIAIWKAQRICIIMQKNFRMFDSKVKLIPLYLFLSQCEILSRASQTSKTQIIAP